MSSLILLCGYPASGKSTFVKGIGDPGCFDEVILCPDDYRKELTGQEFFAPAEEFIWGAVKLTARVQIRAGKTVVIDATHLTKSSRAQWVNIARSLNVPISIWWFKTTYEVCCERNKKRDRVVPEDIMQRMRDTFEPPAFEEGFDRIVAKNS